jgi:hypothetical protein
MTRYAFSHINEYPKSQAYASNILRLNARISIRTSMGTKKLPLGAAHGGQISKAGVEALNIQLSNYH